MDKRMKRIREMSIKEIEDRYRDLIKEKMDLKAIREDLIEDDKILIDNRLEEIDLEIKYINNYIESLIYI